MSHDTSASQTALGKQIFEAADVQTAASAFIQGSLLIVPFIQGACVIRRLLGSSSVLAVSHVADIEQSAPHGIWLRKLVKVFHARKISGRVPADLLSGAHDPSKFAPGEMIFLPFDLRGGESGGFVFMRAEPWHDDEIERLTELLPQVMTRMGFLRRPALEILKRKPKLKTYAVLALLGVVLFFPVRHSSVAPVEVVPVEPSIVASGIPGVVRALQVGANDAVTKGQILVTLDDLDQKSKLAISRRDLNVTEAELRRLQQMGFIDPSQRFRLAELEGQLRIRQLEVERAEAELERTVIRADRDGIAICGDPLDWQGRPVQIGERIMLIADPRRTAARILVPAADGTVLSTETKGSVYLDSQPWRGHSVLVSHWLFEPEQTSLGIFAYRVQAIWTQNANDLRIGMRGTAHLDGHYTPFILHVLRRPIMLLRQVVSL